MPTFPQITDGTNTEQFDGIGFRIDKFAGKAEALPHRIGGVGRAARKLGSRAGGFQATCTVGITAASVASRDTQRDNYLYFADKLVTFRDNLEQLHANLLVLRVQVQFQQLANQAGGIVGSAATHRATVTFSGDDLSAA